MHWATQYIGRPYHPQGEGPDKFHCWSFFRYVQLHHFGRDLPIVPNPENVLAQERTFRDHPEKAKWELCQKPDEGDGVLLRKGKFPVHIGLWVDANGGCVLHCVPVSGVVGQNLPGLKVSQWEIEGYYRFKG
ncbi:hypothetical protein TH9_12160 [Thalassospira xiamenensis]|uniref:NlpC/P60 family protein n=1 Tax=Thalassospira xiamenensis TaxID=220697 RepID=UPI000DED4539|nr:NlpC/P60 family protein [Thalassospira xiamenensis]RCK32482.1 hypothetical protein TH9_12160 [Thalassospira xiamenensis]